MSGFHEGTVHGHLKGNIESAAIAINNNLILLTPIHYRDLLIFTGDHGDKIFSDAKSFNRIFPTTREHLLTV